ncbi:MAG: hypothetical protein HY905_17340 [Deltaproteobacteria bacterium]|nr:hypothetical protein [Deltaproteobacteria bacterium]
MRDRTRLGVHWGVRWMVVARIASSVAVVTVAALCLTACGCRTRSRASGQPLPGVGAAEVARAAEGQTASGEPVQAEWDEAPEVGTATATSAAAEHEDDVTYDPARWVVGVLHPTERHPLSSMAEVQRRVGWADAEMDPSVDEYDPAKESFVVAVPPSPMDPDGLLVWIPAADSGAMPAELTSALEKRHIRYVGLNHAGNERPVAVRMNLALDAVHAVCARMPVRPDRIWIGGISGGAKSASKLALLYPEVFRGGLFVAGAEYFPPVPRSNGEFWSVGIRVSATPEILRRLRERRFVMVTGDRDFSREPVLDYYRAFKKEGFRNVLLLDIPGMAHGMPTPNVLEQALAFLDAPSGAR